MSDKRFDILETKADLIEDNDAEARDLRASLQKGPLFVNLMASPGAGKTTLLERTIRALKDRFRIGVIEADVDSDVDAARIDQAGGKTVQLHTGGSCHMDAAMTRVGLNGLGTDELDLVFLENIGNLVCPAEFDTGADCRVVMLSLPEGDDKPLKYPLMFEVADLLLVSKTDTAPAFDFSLEALRKNIDKVNPGLEIFPLSARTGEGFEAWLNWLETAVQRKRTLNVLGTTGEKA